MNTGPAQSIYALFDRWGEAPALLAELESIIPPNAKEAHQAFPVLMEFRRCLRAELDSQE